MAEIIGNIALSREKNNLSIYTKRKKNVRTNDVKNTLCFY